MTPSAPVEPARPATPSVPNRSRVEPSTEPPPGAPGDVPTKVSPARDGTDLAARVGDLPPQTLEAGMCAMWLFRRQQDSKPVFFSRSLRGPARMVLDGTQVTLDRVASKGRDFAGIRESQTFSYGGTTIQVDVQIEKTARIIDGAEVPRGRLRLEDRAGWSFVIPVYGLIGCQTREAG